MTIASMFRSETDGKYGTIKGVYIPNVLQMLGVILFMRLGWILGHVGMWTMGVIITISLSITLLTSLSMTTIVSNMKMKGGGAYYLISRSLGIEFGSAIGILQCFSQLCSIALCVTGFSLSICEIFPMLSLPVLKVGTLTALVLITYFSTSLAMKTQVLIFISLLTAISAVFWGYMEVPVSLPCTVTSNSMTFWIAFSMFFPAATGIESGMSMSGDLRNPSRSLPLGTIASVITVYIIYVSIGLFLSTHASSEYLRAYPFLLYHINHFGALIMLGVWAATLSSALGAVLGGPRVIQAIAKDGVLPKMLAQGSGITNEPRRATVVVFVLAMILVLFTDINQIVPILTMSCLVSYGFINLIAFMEAFMKNPSWRPTFRLPLFVPLIGGLGCFSAMFLIHSGAAFAVLGLLAMFCFWTATRQIKTSWDDILYSMYAYCVCRGMVRLSQLESSAKNWRPQILTFFDMPILRKNLAFFAHAINQEKGLLIFGANVQSNESHLASELNLHLKGFRIPAYMHINSLDKAVESAGQTVRNYGFGNLKPNTIFFSIPTSFDTMDFMKLILDTHFQKKNIVLLKDDCQADYLYSDPARQKKQINLWWRGKYPGNFEFSLALAYLLQQSKFWPSSKINMKMIAKDELEQQELLEQGEKYRLRLRIKNLEFSSVIHSGEGFFSVFQQESLKADLTFLGLKRPDEQMTVEEYASYYLKLMESTQEVNNIAYVLAGESVQFKKIFV